MSIRMRDGTQQANQNPRMVCEVAFALNDDCRARFSCELALLSNSDEVAAPHLLVSVVGLDLLKLIHEALFPGIVADHAGVLLRRGHQALAIAQAQPRQAGGDRSVGVWAEQVFHQPIDTPGDAILS